MWASMRSDGELFGVRAVVGDSERAGVHRGVLDERVEELALQQRQRGLGLVVEDLDGFSERVGNLAIGEKRNLPWKAHQIPISACRCHAPLSLPAHATRSGVWVQSVLVLSLSLAEHTRHALCHLRTLQHLEYL